MVGIWPNFSQNFLDLTFFDKISSIGLILTKIDSEHGLGFIRDEVFWTFLTLVAITSVEKLMIFLVFVETLIIVTYFSKN